MAWRRIINKNIEIRKICERNYFDYDENDPNRVVIMLSGKIGKLIEYIFKLKNN